MNVFLKKHSSEILVCVSSILHVATPIVAIKESKNYESAKQEILEKKWEVYNTSDIPGPVPKITAKEKLYLAFRYHWKTGVLMSAGVAADMALYFTDKKAIAAVGASANAAIASAALLEEKLKEKLSASEFEEFKTQIDKETVQKILPEPKLSEVESKYPLLGDGKNVIFVDTYSGKEFSTTMDDIRKIEADFTNTLLDGERIMLVEWYQRLACLDPTFKIPEGIIIEGVRKGWENAGLNEPFECYKTYHEMTDGTFCTALTIPRSVFFN